LPQARVSCVRYLTYRMGSAAHTRRALGQILMLLPVYAREVSAALRCCYEVRSTAYQEY